MAHSSQPDYGTALAWTAYGIRDALVFAVGFAMAILLTLPLG